MNRINTVNVTQHVFEENVSYLNLYLLDATLTSHSAHTSLENAEKYRAKVIESQKPGILVKITRTTEGDFMFEKVKEYP